MNSVRASFASYWQSIQHALFPQLEHVLGPLTGKQQQLVRAHSRFPGHALTPTGVMAIRCKQFHLPDL